MSWFGSGECFLKKASSRRAFLAKTGMHGLGLILAARAAPGIQTGERPVSGRAVGAAEDVVFRSAVEMAQMVRAKVISAEELVRAHLARISLVNGALNAVCQLDER